MIIPRGLYGITPDWIEFSKVLQAVEIACDAGLPMLQFRRKIKEPSFERLKQCQAIKNICDKNNCVLIVNDNLELARSCEANGVHLGSEDMDLLDAKLGEALNSNNFIVGMSCYNELELASKAVELGASYIAFGSMFPSPTKPNAVKANLDLIRRARKLFPVTPIVCIGGITLDNAPYVIEAGADMLAVISGLFEKEDIATTIKEFNKLF
ncbi:thiamine phosphate synthase [Taylorella equigenitalis]|uniref:thiamine phosphate synthase n=1 Tax=Taylorella equigenitalis TaxID=29575 RepID=UPI0003F782FC|nr:thiamine phosphate synthase [Taylorella equigenitalis]ASY42793.1 thiamine-phosphate diphosphorylase [Taylorella equigenitalis]RBA26512.1 thiamine phosphate synthase [Taylorella equigenitalis]